MQTGKQSFRWLAPVPARSTSDVTLRGRKEQNSTRRVVANHRRSLYYSTKFAVIRQRSSGYAQVHLFSVLRGIFGRCHTG